MSKNLISQGHNTRDLGFCETACALNQERWNASSLVQMLLWITGDVSEQNLGQALFTLMVRHPLLRATLESEEEKPYRFQIQDIGQGLVPPLITKNRPTRPNFTADETNEDTRYLENATFRPFGPGNLLWRIEFYRAKDKQHALLCHFHHAISDHTSLALFAHDLLRLLSGHVANMSGLPLMKNMEAYMVRDVLEPSEGNRSQTEQPSAVIPVFEKDAPFAERRTRNIYRQIPAPLIRTLRERCHEKSLDLPTLLGAAMALASQGEAGPGAHVPMTTVFDARQFCAEPGAIKGSFSKEHFGYFALVQGSTPCLSENIWETAVNHRDSLATALATTEAAGYVPNEVDKEALWEDFNSGLKAINAGKIFPSGVAVFIGEAQEPRPGETATRNYGSLEVEGSWLWTAQQTGLFKATLCGYLLHDQFYACISHPYPLLSRYKAIEIADQFVALLHEAAS